VDLTTALWRAWPAARETETPGGWLLRETPGVARRRSNCAVAAVQEPDLDAVPADVVQVGLDDAVDRGLAARGWGAEAETDVLVAPVVPGEATGNVRVVPPSVWTPVWAALEGRADGPATEREVVGRLGERARCLLDEEVAAALLVLDPPWAVLLCVVVHPEHRRRGLGRELLAAAHREAAAAGAERLAVQVEQANAPGQALWRGAGFEPAFAYRYRRRA
jgi:ribosomal protein S18 acetylase RimI-like enzyme